MSVYSHTLLQLPLQLRPFSCHTKYILFHSFFLSLTYLTTFLLVECYIFISISREKVTAFAHIHTHTHIVLIPSDPSDPFCRVYLAFLEQKIGEHTHKNTRTHTHTHTHTHTSLTLILHLFPWDRCLFPAPEALPKPFSLPSPSLLPLVLSSFFAGFPPRILPSSI